MKARPEVIDERLTRPDWTTGARRDPKLLWLDKNENTDPKLAAFTSSLLRSLDAEFLFTYPECAPLYQKLSKYLDLPASHLLLTAGSDGAIRSVFEAYIAPGDVVMHTVPTFAMYSVYSKMYGAKVVPLEYERNESGPCLDASRVIQTIRSARPKLFCLPNPDSPTGTVFSEEEMRSIIETCKEVGSLALIDEAYHPFFPKTVLPWVREFEHLVVARTFAKAWGLSGLRIGYAAANPAVAKLLHKVRPMYEVNTIAVAMMEKMLDHSDEMENSVKRLLAGKSHFIESMKSLGFKTIKTEGSFQHVAFGDNAPEIHQALKSIVLYRLDFAEPCLKGYSRFSITSREQFEPVVRSIKESCKRRPSHS